ncbi:uncharacterized protein LOC142341776 isoform X2 [Convolutriloba macropyga]|uniref:uncharacterized protein LOC142341776 isoform X2 n=1 Tax=Convolutriloba macropyga TaxID=536237 RepID=UPI003F51D857
MTDCDIEVIDIEKDNEEDIQIIETKNKSQKSSEADDDKAKEINNENQGIVPTVNTIADDSDSDNDCTLASLAKTAKAEKLKQEASKLGAKPLTDLFSDNANDSQQPYDAEMEERKRKAIELRRQAEEKRAEERKQREEEKRKKEEEKLQKQQETERAKAEKDEAKRLALEKKAEEKRIKEEEKAKKDDDKLLQKQKHLDFQKIEKDAARKNLEEKLAEERKKREEQKEEERKKKEVEKQQKEQERLQKEQERMQKEREKQQKEKEKQAKEQERLQKLKDIEKQRVEKEEAKKMAEDEKKKAEEKENLKRQKQKQFFGSFFKTPSGSSLVSTASRRSSQGEGLGAAPGAPGEGSNNDADILEVLPNGQVKPITDENKPSRKYIGPFVAFEPLPGMKMMPHRRRPQLNIEEFDAAFAKQEHEVSMATIFDKSRKRITRRNIHRLIRDYSEDEKNGAPMVPCLPVATDNLKTAGLRIRMLKDASFVGYLRELMTNEEISSASVKDSTDEKKEFEAVPDTPDKSSEIKDDLKKKIDAEISEGVEPDDDNEVKVIEAAKEGGNEVTIIDDSVVMIEDSKDGAKEKEDEKKQAEEVYELQKLFFKDIKELDLFLLQPTNSGSRKFTMRGKYIRIRHDGEDKSWLDYFGSWRKIPGSQIKLPRRPVVKMEKFFDYNEEDDFYSDVEEAGESVDDSGDDVGSGGDSENEYDYEDEGFLVPHGYLSEEEGGEGDTQDTENYKKQTKEWEARFKKKCVKMVPRMVGPFYGDDKPVELLQFSAVFLCETSAPIQVFSTDDEQCRANKDKLAKKKTGDGENVVTVIPKAAMPSLIRLVHGNTKGLKILVEEFRTFWMKETETLENPQGDNLSKKKLEIKILSMADREKREKEFNKVCWYVSKEVLRQYRLSKLPIPNPSCVGQTLLTGKENQKDASVDQEKGKTFDIAEPPSKRAKFAN